MAIRADIPKVPIKEDEREKRMKEPDEKRRWQVGPGRLSGLSKCVPKKLSRILASQSGHEKCGEVLRCVG
jgi:hypothetical protein